MIDVRTVASYWHGGQGSALYAFASSGTIVDGLESEIEECIEYDRKAPQDPDDASDLQRLLEYVRETSA